MKHESLIMPWVKIHKQIYPNQKPPYWYQLNPGEDRPPFFVFVCPKNHHLALSAHNIYEGGCVSPSIICPEHGCGFHQAIILLSFQRK